MLEFDPLSTEPRLVDGVDDEDDVEDNEAAAVVVNAKIMKVFLFKKFNVSGTSKL